MKKEQPATDQRALVFNNQVQTKLRVKEKKKVKEVFIKIFLHLKLFKSLYVIIMLVPLVV